MDHSRIDMEIKKMIKKEELEIPAAVKQRMNQTLYNLPKQKKGHYFASPLKYLLSGAACILLTLAAISYFLSNETASPPLDKNHTSGGKEDGSEVIIHDYMYSGESEHWRGSVEFFGKGVFYKREDGSFLDYDSESESFFLIEYKGDLEEIAGMEVSYNYKTGTGGGSGTIDEMDQKTISGSSGGNGAMMQKDEVVEVTVEWEGKKESLFLKPDDIKKSGNWEVTPTIPSPPIPAVDGEHIYTLRGLKGKAFYLDTGELKAGVAYKTRWFFWGDDLKEDPGQWLRITAVQKDTGKKENIVVSDNWEINNPQYVDMKDVLKAQASQHVMMTLPSPGLWRLDAYIGDKYYASIVVKVKK
ncbi:DUF4871 domain-containing protein [Bacillus sp. FJAT-29790]|uniref:DUF4871 domain-containing protein n=1 Tax=Bacillus sp. FJAT-29790 TaxID=1895002 RepID=UPI001C2483C4|nr:DUF4871 domain-containing protein [Bacillus sp. FJAT-29790]MBU8880462.1 DUF4871 domain-containing protein [Bacillus sp. FJAT-29790]